MKMVTSTFVPSGFLGDWVLKPMEGIIEKYLADNWTENDVPKKSEIRFGYLLSQNVGDVRTSLTLKCIDNGQEIYDKGTNYASCLFVNKVIVHIEGRRIMENVTKISPVGFEEMRLKVISIINSDPLGLKDSEGIHRLLVDISDPVYPIKDKQNWFAMDINVTTTRFMSRIVIP
jgi:hypothetical protein